MLLPIIHICYPSLLQLFSIEWLVTSRSPSFQHASRLRRLSHVILLLLRMIETTESVCGLERVGEEESKGRSSIAPTQQPADQRSIQSPDPNPGLTLPTSSLFESGGIRQRLILTRSVVHCPSSLNGLYLLLHQVVDSIRV